MKRSVLVLVILATAVGATPGGAVTPPLGARAGYTSWEGVHQFHFGGHAKLGDLFPNIALTPNFELGFGDNATVITVNGDLAYRFTELANAPWGPYAGGCLSFIYVDFSGLPSDTNLGLSGVVGTTYALSGGNELLAEIRFGIMDSPGFKFTVGYTFF